MTTTMTLQPIGFVRSPRRDVEDDDWGDVEAVIELTPDLDADALAGIEDFSHAEILFVFDRVPDGAIERTARHPRNNPAWPRVGVFAQRGKSRPNRLGSTIVRIVERRGRALHVRGLDAVDCTPVLDIKPVMTEFLPRDPVRQPAWSTELMRDRLARGAQRVRPSCPTCACWPRSLPRSAGASSRWG